MNIFKLIGNLYTNKSSSWINELEDNDIQPYVIQRWLAMNDRIRVQTRWLDKYVFYLPQKMYLSLAWSIIPKSEKAPFVKYIKQNTDVEEFDFILSKIRKQFKLSDNDFNSVKETLIKTIKENMTDYFSYYGVEKRYWKKYFLKFDKIKEFGGNDNNVKKQDGLAKWGL